jgi:PPOX class probable F420-dependent enzyme
MELTDALDFARNGKQAVLTTIRSNGRPQLSNIFYSVADDGIIRISITADRAKYTNLAREPWAALHITREDFFAYAVIEGDVELSAIAAAPDDDAVEELLGLYRAVMGEHPDWDEFRASMVKDKRAVIRITPTRAYGMV